ncbi:uncharacterized protein Z519_08827 [Cladophialophora bantiana CBS 173.52]|uniref:FAD-binding domain-containing protein n=1 Tax=Cladophialophora bantiana (strain ATCC 10958 / CBS 173.52 / CDC B-1940 / NIH 8579) TaxID=1442370 RepID=A0A0D2HZZ2_CLAB1|nr:uncharacterized protein Z519_08827 [Cladophialophora bantiana CBS 173.52]KIW90184.1 hypothetical protein Z519_08827 [Cladophialophora bantiana CBS 173.52]
MDLIDTAIKQGYFRKANSMLEDDNRKMATHVILAEGKDQGEVIARLGWAKGRKTVARLNLVTGSTATADCLIGADGIHSATRQYVLRRDHPDTLPVNHNRWYRVGGKLPMEEVEKTLSPLFLRFVPILCGPNGRFNMTPIHYGKTMNIGFYTRAQSDGEVGTLPNPDDFVRYDLDGTKMVEVIHDHDAAPYFNKGRVVMMGDAAHSTYPFMDDGAGQAIEDGAVLHAPFAHVKHKSEIPAVFTAFDEVRRPRALRVVEMARNAGLMYPYDFERFRCASDSIEALKDSWKKFASFTNNADLGTQNQMAISVYQCITGQQVNGVY